MPRPDDPREAKYRSYLVRMWRSAGVAPVSGAWQAEIESVQSGRKWRFANLDQTFQFLWDQVQSDAEEDPTLPVVDEEE